MLTLTNDSISGRNTAQGGTGGIGSTGTNGTAGAGQGGGLFVSSGSVTLKFSIVTFNSASTKGGGIFGGSLVTQINTLVIGNSPNDITP